MQPDVSVVIVFHDEELHCLAALDSMKDNVDVARSSGLVVEARAILDAAGERTRDLVGVRGRWLDGIDEVSFCDLALTRNAATEAAGGKFIAFLDGDDLWGERWILEAYRCATMKRQPAIWHPEYLYFFYEDGFHQHSTTTVPHQFCRASYGVQLASDAPDFDPRSLIFANPWTSNAMALRDIYLRFPYVGSDLPNGVGFSDWAWNIRTINSGIPHLIVASTLHAVRRKTTTSLSARMREAGGLPMYYEPVIGTK